MAICETDNLEIYDTVGVLDNLLHTGVFPDQSKTAEVRPVYK